MGCCSPAICQSDHYNGRALMFAGEQANLCCPAFFCTSRGAANYLHTRRVAFAGGYIRGCRDISSGAVARPSNGTRQGLPGS